VRLKEVLRGIKCDRISYVDHASRSGNALFAKACEMDLEGIIAKHRLGKYMSGREQSTWFKIRNRYYSQWDGRARLDICSKAAGMQETKFLSVR
jgi:ATP-dependent DNA ligase